jgi:hypothetical protein
MSAINSRKVLRLYVHDRNSWEFWEFWESCDYRDYTSRGDPKS